MRSFSKLIVATVLLAIGAAPVGAVTIRVYTDKAAWQNALGRQFQTEDFADDHLIAGVSFESTESGHINPAQECYQDVLASESQNEPMTTWRFVLPITAYGGNWTLGGPGGSGNSLLVYIDDFSLYVGAIPNSYGGGFWGFVSDTPLTSVRLVGGAGAHQQNYRLDDMVYGSVPSKSDFDEDGDVDADDLGIFTACATGPAIPYDPGVLPEPAPGCTLTPNGDGHIASDFDEDGDVDQLDFAVLQRCYSGENLLADPTCVS
jgi:hypothetical protein